MTLPDKTLFTIQEACDHLALSKSTVNRLINSGQLVRVHPSRRTARITRESLAAHLERSATPGAVAQSIEHQAQARAAAAAQVERQQQEAKKKSLGDRWGLGAIFGQKAEKAG